jgi:manganese transport protein
VAICLAITLTVLLGGGYARIERFAVFKVAIFTVITVCAAAVLLRTPGAVSTADFASGLSFALPASGLATAMAVFGITGVGATELAMYPYWCVEKGYARFVGPRDGTPEWTRRARGWIRVMHLDITCSLAIYTMATVAFYLLGAGVLHSMGVVPAAKDTVAVLSNIYTRTLGGWALPLFYFGVVVTLYGTIFAATAAHSRMMADLACLAGAYSRGDAVRRLYWRRVFVIVLATVPAIFYWFFESPVRMVVAGGIAQALMLPLLGAAAIYLRHTQLPRDLEPSLATTIALWICTAVMLAFALYYLGSALL